MNKRLMQYFSGELTAGERQELIHRIENNIRPKAEFIRLQNPVAVSQLSFRQTDPSGGKIHFRAFADQLKNKSREN